MGRHSLAYIAAQQGQPSAASDARRASGYVGRIGLLAVALGIGAAVAGGTATASADTPTSNTSSDSSEQSSTQPAAKQRSQPASSDDRDASTPSGARADDDPGATSGTALTGVRRTSDDRASDDETVDVATPAKTRSSRQSAQDTETVTTTDHAPVGAPAAADTAIPSPDDQTATDYGDIGKWMLQPDGEIADYGGLPYEGRTVLEPVNVIIVDPTSRNALEATWRLNAAMRRSGFPPRLFHSTGFRGLIDDQRYRQQPRGLLVGYSDDFFLVTNNHGRIFGPDPVETASGYVWSGAFSTEEFVFHQGLPRHAYVSSNMARAALAARLVASGRAQLGDMVSLDNSYNTETTTTGDHDGKAVVVILTDPYATRAAALVGEGSVQHRTCVAAGDPADISVGTSCVAVAVAYRGSDTG